MSQPIRLRREQLPLEAILLDPNNPRFHDMEDWDKIEENLYHLDTVQNATFQRIEGNDTEQIEALRNSIRSNGFINAETIVVKPYAYRDGKYVVIEGNRRFVSVLGIIRASLNPNEDPIVAALQTLEVLVYETTNDPQQDQVNEMILQGIRHLSGPKQWGAYQQANLIIQLRDKFGQDWPEISARIGLGPRVAARYYRAAKALTQMKDDEEFGDLYETTLFSLFDETVSKAPLRAWLGWSDELYRFGNLEHTRSFYQLLVGDPISERKPTITNPRHLKQFNEVVASGKDTVLHRLLDGEIGIEDAARLVLPEPVKVSLRSSLRTFLKTLAEFPAEDLAKLENEEVSMIEEVMKKLGHFKKMHQALATVQAE